jgi:hypothetical protein
MTSDRLVGDHYLDAICVCRHRWGDHRPDKTCVECDCRTFKERSTVMSDTKPFPQELYEIADMLGLSLYDLSKLCLKEASRISEDSVAQLADRIKLDAATAEIMAHKTLSLDNPALRQLGEQMFNIMRDHGYYGRP